MKKFKHLLPASVLVACMGTLVGVTACGTQSYTITFDSDGGTAIQSMSVDKGTKATKPDEPTKVGYTFSGWYLNDELYTFEDVTTITSDITLKAHWDIKYLSVAFDYNNGTTATVITSVQEGQTVSAPAEEPVKYGYTFNGWYQDSTLYSFSTAVMQNITLTANWEEKDFNVTFDYNDGSESVVTPVQEGQVATAPASPERIGYTFAGWYVGDTAYDFETPVTADLTLTAKWEVKYVTVTFDYDDNATASVTQTVQQGQPFTAPTAPADKLGYIFGGWACNGEVLNFANGVLETATYKPVWNTVMVSDITLNTSNVKQSYFVGDTLSTENLGVTVVLSDYQSNQQTLTVDLADANLSIDASNVNMNKEGTYTIYVGYTLQGTTRYAHYTVTVSSQISGIHGIELVKNTTEYNVAVEGVEVSDIDLSDLKVYSVNQDGTLGDEITEGITYTYFVEDEEVAQGKLTTENARKFQIWASVSYTVGNETYYMTDFVVVTVIGNTIETLTFKSGTTSQEQGYTDSISSTWVFTAKYSLTGEAEIDLTKATVGTGAGQYTLSNFLLYAAGSGEATLTYYYAVGSEVMSATCKVPYDVNAATEASTYSAVLDPIGVTNNNPDREGAIEVRGSYANGAEIVPFMVYAKGDISVTKENKAGVTDSTKLYDRLQFNSTNGITVYLAGDTTLTFYARYGSSSGDGAAFVAKQGDNVVAQSTDIPFDKDHYRVVTLTLKAGAYDIVASVGSLNVFLIELTGSIKAPTLVKADIDSLELNGSITEETAIGENGIFSIVASSASSSSVKVEATEVTINGKTFTKQINLGGAKKTSNARSVKVIITEEMIASGSCTLTVYAGHGGEAARTLGVYASGNEKTNYLMGYNIVGSGTVATFTFTQAGTYYLGSASNGMNIYGMQISYVPAETANGEAE
jgi:uncharacterized repeat protein (TIGR02543 family)